MTNKFQPYENLIEERKGLSGADKFFFMLIATLTLIMIIIAYLNAYVYMLVQVDGASMEPTFYTDDVVVVNRKKQPTNGDIVIIDGEKQDSYIIKRVIGVGGQTVKIEDGYVYVDGEMLEEPYLEREGITFPYEGGKSEWQIPQGEFLFFGDNRLNSTDSRYAGYDTCKRSQIVGVVEEWSMKIIKVNEFLYNLGGDKS